AGPPVMPLARIATTETERSTDEEPGRAARSESVSAQPHPLAAAPATASAAARLLEAGPGMQRPRSAPTPGPRATPVESRSPVAQAESLPVMRPDGKAAQAIRTPPLPLA